VLCYVVDALYGSVFSFDAKKLLSPTYQVGDTCFLKPEEKTLLR
jgi:hypothetical protein